MRVKKSDAFLIGPFIGELGWEMYRFAPYIISLKKEFPSKKMVVFTRPSRFDLYGSYADILVPLKILNDDSKKHFCFTIKEFHNEDYRLLATAFKRKYEKRYIVKEHIYPDISMFYSKLKWQFPRNLMDYEFRPRISNIDFIKDNFEILDNLIFINENIQISDWVKMNYNLQSSTIILNELEDDDINNRLRRSFVGCSIEMIKRSKFVISNINSFIGHLSLLLKTPVISVNEEMSDDSIKLLNPLNTPVIKCDDIESGIKYYEDNF